MQRATSIRDYFTQYRPYEEVAKLRKTVILNPTPITELEAGVHLCDRCDGTGLCKTCKGKGDCPHYCSCDFCTTTTEECSECVGDGKCTECSGVGVIAPRA